MQKKTNKKYDANSIKVLEGLEAVRMRPGMYIGSVDSRGVNHLLFEIMDNAVDEHLAGYCDKIYVTLNKDGSATVRDNGRGIPVDMHEKGISAERVIFTTLHAGGKFEKSSYAISGGLHGVGSSVVNALTSKLFVTVWKDGTIYKDTYEKGEPTTKLIDGLLPTFGNTRKKGTEVTFYPDKDIFGKHDFKASIIKNRLHESAYLNPGLTIHFENKRENEEEKIDFHEEEGIVGFIKALNKEKNTVTDIISYHGELNGLQLEVAFQYHEGFEEQIIGFCNNILNTEGGTHLTGFKNKLTTIMNGYAKELGVLKEKDPNFTGADVRSGMTAIIVLKHPDPMFEGQTKTKLGSSDANPAVATITGEQLPVKLDRNIEDTKAMLDCALRSAKVRKAEMKNKNNLLAKPKFAFDTNGKLANCESKKAEECEIFIVEGDSAGGSAKTARNRKTQAILPIRGKILNVEKASMDKILANAEIKTMIHSFGCGFSEGFGNDFDISKLRYHKIIIMADADVDGAHIATLLLTFFYRFMPELIQEGHIYVAMPPLYKASKKKENDVYLFNDDELTTYRKTHRNFSLQRYKGLGEMDADQLWETTMDPNHRWLKQIQIEDFMFADSQTELLMGNKVEPRRNYITENAHFANIDL